MWGNLPVPPRPLPTHTPKDRRMSRRPQESLVEERPDVLVCGASFAGLAVARELAGSGADVLVLDRDEIGAHPTSACAAPMPWLEALGVEDSMKQELPFMRFTTPHGSFRVSAPLELGRLRLRGAVPASVGHSADARFERALVKGRVEGGVRTDRGVVQAPLVVDALGWRRVLGSQPLTGTRRPALARPRGPSERQGRRARRRDRSVARPARLLLARACGRRGARRCRRRTTPASPSSSRPPTPRLASACPRSATRATSFRIGSGPPSRTAASSSATLPGTASPSRPRGFAARSTSGSHAAASCAACWRATRPATRRSRRTPPSAAKHRRGFWITYALQRLIPALPPRALTGVLQVLSRQRLVDAIFNWYLGLLPVTAGQADAPRRLRAKVAATTKAAATRTVVPPGGRSA